MELRRASLDDVLRHMVLKNRSVTAIEYRLTVELAIDGRVWAGYAGGEPVAIGGLRIVDPAVAGTAWLSVLPRLDRSIAAAALLMRRVVRMAQAEHAAGVVCVVEGGNRSGARLARALGFERSERTLGSLVEWRYVGEP